MPPPGGGATVLTKADRPMHRPLLLPSIEEHHTQEAANQSSQTGHDPYEKLHLS